MNPRDAEAQRHWEQAGRFAAAGNLDAATAELAALAQLVPNQAGPRLALAQVAHLAGRFHAAVRHAHEAATAVRRSGDFRPLADVALELHALGETRSAVDLIQSDDALPQLPIEQADRLARCLGLCDRHAEALTLLDAAIDRAPSSPGLAFTRATTLRHLGRIDAATAEYDRCVTLAPGYAAAMLMLAEHAPGHESGAQLARIRTALARLPREDSLDAAMLHYALFIQLDRAEDRQGAWEALVRGAAIKRRLIGVSPGRDAEWVAAIHDLCQGDFLASVSGAGSVRTPIFIVGQPRTGTTILERILGNHSRVASAGELEDFHLALCWEADRLVARRDATLVRICPRLDFAAVGRGYRERTAWRAPGQPFLVDKHPDNVWYAALIHKALPEARIICLLRDPVDTCLSNLKELFAGAAYPESYDPMDAAMHLIRFRRLLDEWESTLPGVILTIQYEELVQNPEPVIRRVMDHCGLPFEPASLDIVRNRTPSATASSSQVRQPLHTRAIGAWRRYAEPLAAARALLEKELPASAFTARSPSTAAS